MIKAIIRKTFILLLISLLSTLIPWRSGIFAERINIQQSFIFRITLSQKNCQLAIWLADEKGVFVDTIYVTNKVAKKGMGNRGGGLDDKWRGSRLSVLPVWAHQRHIDYGGGNFYPTKEKPLPDAITSATSKAGEFVWIWEPDRTIKPGEYFYYVEINQSFDKNEHNDYSWYRGQPSVVWSGNLLVGYQISESKAKIIGHGHVAGTDGEINPDLSTLTTSLKLIEEVKALYKP